VVGKSKAPEEELPMTARRTIGFVLLLLSIAAAASVVRAADAPPPAAEKPVAVPPSPPGLTRLSPKYDVWIDKENKRVVMVGEVCLREGQMEMFACLKNTKEHEAIVAVPTEAFVVHAALLAVGAEPGNPARFLPTYQPARGTEVEVHVYWSDADGKRHDMPAESWLRNLRTGKNLDQPWVFGGSGFWVDPTTGERRYQAEDGDFICVSNFTSAMLDLPIESSQMNNALLFEAFSERIPPKGTKVCLVLTPHLKGLAPDRGNDPKADLPVAEPRPAQ
jgi:hypothetical protein